MKFWPPEIPPVWMRRINGISVILWLVVTVVQNFTDWAESVAYVSNLSTWALVMSSLGAWQASRVEVNMADADVASEVVDAIVEKTEINPVTGEPA
jgi:hypothetical protein